MAHPERLQRTFSGEQSIGEARRFVRDALDAWDLGEVVDLAVLGVSELLTNVLLHAGTRAEVGLILDGSHLRVEVQDWHAGRVLPPTWGRPADDAEGGRGLMIAAALAPAWGVRYTRTSKTVWLDFSLTGEDGSAPPDQPTDGPADPTAIGRRAVADRSGVLVGLSHDALNRLGVDDFLMLAVERARASLRADAAYLLIVSDFSRDFEVRALSGLDTSLLGVRIEAEESGMPGARNPTLPILVPDLSMSPVPLLAGTTLRSLVAVAITVDGRVAGVLGAASERPDDFTDDQAALLRRAADAIAGAVDRARLRTAERERRGWLSFLSEAGDLLAGSLDEHMTMAIVAQIAVPQLGRWCAIYLHDQRQNPVLEHVWHQDERVNAELRRLLEQSGPSGTIPHDDPLGGALVTLPLTARGQRIGVLLLGRDTGGRFGGEMYLVAESLARRAALAIDNARAHSELKRVGRALQDSLLPPSVPSAAGMEIGVVYQAASETCDVGGDFYDIFALDGSRWLFVVGDVCGKGAQAAAVTGLARHTIRALARTGFPVGEILERLNTAILEEHERARHLTLVCGIVEPTARGNVLMRLVCAGHPPPFLVAKGGTVRQIGRSQAMLGVFDDVAYTADDLVLYRGDLLVTVTDGVLERRDGRRTLGEDGLSTELELVADLPAQAVADRIRSLVRDFASTPPQDDMAVLALRFGTRGSTSR